MAHTRINLQLYGFTRSNGALDGFFEGEDGLLQLGKGDQARRALPVDGSGLAYHSGGSRLGVIPRATFIITPTIFVAGRVRIDVELTTQEAQLLNKVAKLSL